jgi:hypothetical protein
MGRSAKALTDSANAVRETPTTPKNVDAEPQVQQSTSTTELQPPLKIGGASFHPNNPSMPLPKEKWRAEWKGLKGHTPPRALQDGEFSLTQVGKVSVAPMPKNGEYIPSSKRGPDPFKMLGHKTVDIDGTDRPLTDSQKAENKAIEDARTAWSAHQQIEDHHHVYNQTEQSTGATSEQLTQQKQDIKSLSTPHKIHAENLRSAISGMSHLTQHDLSIGKLAERISTNAYNAALQHKAAIDRQASLPEGHPERMSEEELQGHIQGLSKSSAVVTSLKGFRNKHLKAMSNLVTASGLVAQGQNALRQGNDKDAEKVLMTAARHVGKAASHLNDPITRQVFERAGVELPSSDLISRYAGDASRATSEFTERAETGTSKAPTRIIGQRKVTEGAVRDVKPVQAGGSVRKPSYKGGEGIEGSAEQVPTTVKIATPRSAIDAEADNKAQEEALMAKHMGIAYQAIVNGARIPADTRKHIGEKGVQAVLNHIASRKGK